MHTDDEFWQTVTRVDRAGGNLKVCFDDFLEIPAACFVVEEIALSVVAHWMAAGTLPPDAPFSDELFGL
ncbi:hypothetical protein [Dactylosporangium darangshiense]|uniref:Uncharacterized protein n=1 Tax=Dactylosporangium darangshiense TaxID=579108 RepID=A0ABP8DLJ1_9ACTN